jgi:DNA-binding response OmpR family regulator
MRPLGQARLSANLRKRAVPESAKVGVGRMMSRIAIYEDDELVRTLLQEWLSEAGYVVVVPGAGDAACHSGEPDLAIVSVFMPKERGYERIHTIRERHPCTLLLAISGQFRSGLPAIGPTAESLGVHRIIAKPCSRQDLLEAVRAMIEVPQLATGH